MFSSLPAFDHAAICAPNIEALVDNFEALGFSVQQGGGNGPLISAIVPFSDNTYLELSASRSPMLRQCMRFARSLGFLPRLISKAPTDTKRRFAPWLCADRGFIDWAVMVEDMGRLVSRAREDGIECYDPGPFRRVAPGYEEPTWQLASAIDRALPFLIEDDEGSVPRISPKASRDHANGATRISRLVVAVDEPQTYESYLTRYLGRSDLLTRVDAVPASDGHVGLVRMDITAAVSQAQQLDPALTFGAEIYLVPA